MSPFVSEITIILLPIFFCLSHIIEEAFIIIALPMEDDQYLRNYFHFKTYSLNVFIMRCNKVFVGLLRLQQTMLYWLLPVSHIIILLLQDDQSVHNYFYSKTYFQNVFFCLNMRCNKVFYGLLRYRQTLLCCLYWYQLTMFSCWFYTFVSSELNKVCDIPSSFSSFFFSSIIREKKSSYRISLTNVKTLKDYSSLFSGVFLVYETRPKHVFRVRYISIQTF